MELRPQDFITDTFFSTGTAGFPLYNGVKVTHVPTGISVKVSEYRSAHTNRYSAFRQIKELLETQTDVFKQRELF